MTEPSNGWTMKTLHDHLEAKLEAVERCLVEKITGNDLRYEQRFAATQEAIRIATENKGQVWAAVSVVVSIVALGVALAMAVK